MQLQLWQYQHLQAAAENACRRTGQDPYQATIGPNDEYRPLWMSYAEKLAELETLITVARQHGLFF